MLVLNHILTYTMFQLCQTTIQLCQAPNIHKDPILSKPPPVDESVNPNGLGVWYDKGVALYNLGKYNESIECYDKVIKIIKHALAGNNIICNNMA
jgi:tetratricopeptide (TPR) repeat protein